MGRAMHAAGRVLFLALLALAAAPVSGEGHMGDEKETVPLGDPVIMVPRLNPGDGFEKYEGGFDLSDDGYLGSTAFMGMPAFVIAIVLILVMVLMFVYEFLSVLCKCFPCCRKGQVKVYTKAQLNRPIYAMAVFAVVSGLGCFLIYAGGPQLLDGMQDTTDAMVDSIGELGDDVGLISDALAGAVAFVGDVANDIGQLNEQMDYVDEVVNDNADDLKNTLEQYTIVFLITACAFLGLAIVGMAFSVLGWSKLLVIVCWIGGILLILAWIIFGLSSVVYVIVDDLCTAMDGYLEEPETSDLSSLIPCLDEQTAIDTMGTARESIFTIIKDVNDRMRELEQPPVSVELPLLCMQYTRMTKEDLCWEAENGSSDFDPVDEGYIEFVCESDIRDYEEVYPRMNCPFPRGRNYVTLGEFVESYEPFRCEYSSNDSFQQVASCRQDGLVPSDYWDDFVLSAGDDAQTAQNIIDVEPNIAELIRCEFVDSTFQKLTGTPCDNLTGGLELLWTGFLMVSLGYLCLWTTWVIAAKRYGTLSQQKQQSAEAELADMDGAMQK